VNGKLLTPRMSGRYMRVRLRSNHRIIERAVHHLVLEAFVGQRPAGFQGCDTDGDTKNNALSNLRWDTAEGNRADALRHGTAVVSRARRCRAIATAQSAARKMLGAQQ
jgi:HNH endonuclease